MPEQEFEPPVWTLHNKRVLGGYRPGIDQPQRSPLYYTAPGGWLILNDPQPGTPDRPWALYRHGVEVERTHTLRIARHFAHRMVTTEQVAR